MATTQEPARPFPGPAAYPLDAGQIDEAFVPTGAPRHPYAELLGALARHDLVVLRERVRSNAAALGLSFGPDRPIAIDPVPRLIAREDWEPLRAALLQRARALNAFLLDVYGEGRIFEAELVPRSLLESSSGYEPRMAGLLDPALPPATVAGMDLIRAPSGELLVLEDNLRMPSGVTFAMALREAVTPVLDSQTRPLRDDGYLSSLGAAIRAAAPDGRGDPAAAILSDGPGAGTFYEHQRLARELDLPIVTPGQLEPAEGRLFARLDRDRVELDVLYRRTDEDRLSTRAGGLTPLGELLMEPLETGRLRCLNAFGTGVADDKLAHSYSERMVNFYLQEEPLLRSVPSFDLAEEGARGEALERLDELVVKARDGFGGHGVTIMPRAGAEERRRVAAAVRETPERFVAQETVELSTHPTVCDEGLRPRRVDLRPYVISGAGGELAVFTGGLTRYAREAGEMIVNSSRGGGCKDTWVVDVPGGDE